MADNNGWISVNERLPEIRDDSALAYWQGNGGMDMVHVGDFFGDITNGRDENGNQKYTKLYLSHGITHWQPMPEAPTK
ncbi:Protein of uncharacterised function (DUF551) [Morganella morganii]|uniref:DUF551 domain-containing protein n=1 Tax=Morganella morganii subsp. morganii KT TaxID=1124991 RepID=M1SQ72_MORMO|nr:DUF551 domain-containing protein [Morganella morganii]AGG31981.1 hypothetical protein MU9_2936 [Morganella morganii subsp. morganii KT]AZP25204.1 DUF551 domain-containing protein [Morganella morganii]MBS9586035.1 DUF551 domain-containing protein [Morganella morganii subsp. morganii]QWL86877.1 DUF551 domain-containing protein [Morganella morganii subsp. morganii]SQL23294.1 Protein of uncharacterised function (DUF551) [Morganella morganii]